MSSYDTSVSILAEFLVKLILGIDDKDRVESGESVSHPPHVVKKMGEEEMKVKDISIYV
jgi:hypothetical protein